MTRIIADISISLDGYVTGPGRVCTTASAPAGGPAHLGLLGRPGGPPHRPGDDRTLRRRRPGPEPLRHRRRPEGLERRNRLRRARAGKPSLVVVTSAPPASVRTSDLDWTFVTTGVRDAVAAARERAEAASARSGKDLDVYVMGGGLTISSALDAGLIDVLTCTSHPWCWAAAHPLHRRSAAHLHAAKRDPHADGDAHRLRRTLLTTPAAPPATPPSRSPAPSAKAARASGTGRATSCPAASKRSSPPRARCTTPSTASCARRASTSSASDC